MVSVEAEDLLEVLQHCEYEDFRRLLGPKAASGASEVVMTASKRMYASPLPPDWSEQVDHDSSYLYFYNKVTGESLWEHPQRGLFIELIQEVASWRENDSMEMVVARSDMHMRQAHMNASDTISSWSAVECDDGAGGLTSYYANLSTGETRWSDPRKTLEFDLWQRQYILSACMATHAEELEMNARAQPKALQQLPEATEALYGAPSPGQYAEALAASFAVLAAQALAGLAAANSKAAPDLDAASAFAGTAFAASTMAATCADATKGCGEELTARSEASTTTPSSAAESVRSFEEPATSRSELNSFHIPSLDLEKFQRPPPSAQCAPPSTPNRWLAHARYVNAKIRTQNDELKLIILQTKRIHEKMKQYNVKYEDRYSDNAWRKALWASFRKEFDNIKQWANKCLSSELPEELPPPPPMVPHRSLPPTGAAPTKVAAAKTSLYSYKPSKESLYG